MYMNLAQICYYKIVMVVKLSFGLYNVMHACICSFAVFIYMQLNACICNFTEFT